MSLGNKFVSLYCGTGGLDIGFASAGFQCIAAFDSDVHAVESHNQNLGGDALQVDLRHPSQEVYDALAAANVVIAGPPCQGFSTAGSNDPDDARNLHLNTVARLAAHSNADVIVIENVKGLLARRNYNHLERCKLLLEEAGFTVVHRLFDLSKFGIPQTRKRVLIVGSRTPFKIELRIEPQEERKTLRDAISHLADVLKEESQLRKLTRRDILISNRIAPGQRLSNVRLSENSIHTWDIPEVFGTTTQRQRLILNTIVRLRRQNRVRNIGDADPVEKSAISSVLEFDVQPALETLLARGFVRRAGDLYDLTHTFNGKYKRLIWEQCAPTVDTRFLEPRYFLHPEESRGFSVLEMAALQEFPSDFLFPRSLAISSRLIGNAVPPTFAAKVATQIRNEAGTA